jgi:hypothetical protein
MPDERAPSTHSLADRMSNKASLDVVVRENFVATVSYRIQSVSQLVCYLGVTRVLFSNKKKCITYRLLHFPTFRSNGSSKTCRNSHLWSADKSHATVEHRLSANNYFLPGRNWLKLYILIWSVLPVLLCSSVWSTTELWKLTLDFLFFVFQSVSRANAVNMNAASLLNTNVFTPPTFSFQIILLK